jgi:hypothetical protein
VSYEIRLDEFGAERSGYSTVIIAEEEGRSIHWGNASHHGETRPIVTVKFGFLSITVDTAVFGKDGKKMLSALHHRYHFQIIDEVEEAKRLADTTVEDRIAAAYAAIAADDYELACNIESSVLFNKVAIVAVNALAGRITMEHVEGILREASHEAEAIHRRGMNDAKAELRAWLDS